MRTIPALLALLATGCAAPGEPAPERAPSPGGGEVTVQITHAVAENGNALDPAATARGDEGGVTVRGVIPTPNPCHRLRAAAEAAGGGLTLTVEATMPPDTGCIASLGTLSYTAVVRGLAPGTLAVRVVHRYPNTGWEQARLDAGTVQVR